MPDSHQTSNEPAAGDPNHEAKVELLRVVRSLARELHPSMRHLHKITLDSDLERDIGFDSLGLAELILRINKAFKVRLPDQLLGEADTVGSLLIALQAAGPELAHLSVRPSGDAVSLPSIEPPSRVETLIEVMEFHVHNNGARPHLRLWKAEGEEDEISYAELHHAACHAAQGLIELGVTSGTRVAIMLPTEAGFFEAFLGTLYAGAIPVPMYPPFRRSQIEDHLRRQASIIRNADACVLIVSEELRRVGSLLLGLAPGLKQITTVGGLKQSGMISRPLAADADTVALIQYTSGSTGDPKGVVLTHANLLANIRSMGEALEASSSDTFVSWLPLYHDMGLIGAWLGSLYFGAHAILMSPLAFLADPSRWLRTISHYRATLSAAPNFAFELCHKRISDEDIEGLDLSSLRMIVNGAEPVSPVTINRFTKRFSKFKFRPEMLGPVYGLAENSVGLAFPPMGRKPIIDRIQRIALSRDGVAISADPDDETALEFVACGQPIPGHEIRIVDDYDNEVPERREGRLQFRGPSATRGYFRNEEKNRTLFSGDWLESHDRAYIADGDIYITGRIKDMIIKAGRNIYPHEIEDLVGEIEDVRKGCVAAVAGINPQSGTEMLVLVVETRLTDQNDKDNLKKRIRETCSTVLDIPPDVVELVPPRTVPKTSSGKVRRAATRSLYESGLIAQHRRGFRQQLLLLAVSGIGGRARRIFSRVRQLAYAGYWWFILVSLAVVTWPMVVALPRRSWRHSVVHRAARWFLWLTGTRFTLNADHQLPDDSAVFVANHASYLDSLVISAAIAGPLTFIAKEELAEQIVAGPFLNRLHTLFVRRTITRESVEDTDQQLVAVRNGERIVSFPEGTLTRRSGLMSFHLGPFIVAAEAGIPVIPVTIRGTRSILRGGTWLPSSGGDIAVIIGDPLEPDGRDFSAAVSLRDRARAVILRASGEPDLYHERINIQPT